MTNSELIELVEELSTVERGVLDFGFRFHPVFGPEVSVDCRFFVTESGTLETLASHFRNIAKDGETIANKLEEIIKSRKEN